MNYLALACDYDGTLATNGRVSDETLAALAQWRDSGRKLILVTGREFDDLMRTFGHIDLFHGVVAENGAFLYHPATERETPLGEPPPDDLIEWLRQQDVAPLSVGRVIVGTAEPHHTTARKAIRKLGLDLQVIFNKGAVMVLPSGINKATGLEAALSELDLSPQNVIGIGDAENDQAFLERCGYAVAVANALPALKESADLVTEAEAGAGVAELIDGFLQ